MPRWSTLIPQRPWRSGAVVEGSAALIGVVDQLNDASTTSTASIPKATSSGICQPGREPRAGGSPRGAIEASAGRVPGGKLFALVPIPSQRCQRRN